MSAYEEGNQDSKITLIGEAPSFNEIRENRPFVGPAGGLLESCLHAAGLTRAEIYILNCFEDRVFKKEGSDTIYDAAGSKLWTGEKGFTDLGLVRSQNCLQRIGKSTANVFCPIGATAFSLLTGKTEITKWRGSIIPDCIPESGRKVIGTIHPAGALRGMYVWRYLIAADLKRVKAESLSPTIDLPRRQLIIDPSFEEVALYLKTCLHAPAVATDIEILNGQVDCFSLATSPESAICIPIIDAGFEPRWTPVEEAQIWGAYADILGNPYITKINQNITFDLSALLQLNNIVPEGPLHDPMIAHSVMNPALDKKLGVLCSLYTREPYYKDDGDLRDGHSVKDFKRRWLYNAKDSVIAFECMNVLLPMLDADGYRSTYDRTIAVLPALVEMMVRGFKVNVPELRATRERVRTEIKALLVRMEQAINRPVITIAPKTAKQKQAAANALNVNSPKQLMDYFYKELKLKPYTKGNKPTIDDKALARIFRTHRIEFAKMMQDYRGLAKYESTYLDVALASDERLRCSFNPRGTWTGRLSSSKTVFGDGMNLQNLAPEFRSFMTAG